METTEKRLEKSDENSAKLTASLEAVEKELTALKADHSKCGPEIEQLQQLAEKGNEFGMKAQSLEAELKELRAENETLTDNYNRYCGQFPIVIFVTRCKQKPMEIQNGI